MFLAKSQVWQRRTVIAWSVFAGLAVLWDFSWCFVFRQMQSAGIDHDWRIVWAVYGKADDRYLHGDRYLLTLEFITGLCSLLNFYVVHQLRRGTRERALVALFAVSIMEVYGALIYFGSEALNHFANVDTASFVHTWLMFVGMNALWLIFPGWCIYEVVAELARGASRTEGAYYGQEPIG
jgi:cholestenol delta-isomerase